MKKRIISAILVGCMIASFTACNNQHDDRTDSTTRVSESGENSDIGEPNQSISDTVATTESANNETTEVPTNQGSTTGEAVDPAPYWQGDDYFDMLGYLEACGCKIMYMTLVDESFHFSDTYSSDIMGYSVFFAESASHPNDSSASLVLCFTNNAFYKVNTIGISYYDNNNGYHESYIPLPIFDNQRNIVVDQYGNTLDIHTIAQIEMLINKLHSTQFHGETFEYMNTFFEDYNQY